MALTITSPAFRPMGTIPRQYTCDDADSAPPLEWANVPAGARSLALIVDDPDAPDPAKPQRTYAHWVLYDIPPSATGLPEGAKTKDLPPGAREGTNDWKRIGYGGPCPPVGRHRYFFKLYALDTQLGDLGPATKAKVEGAMANHVLEVAELVGTYERNR